MATKATLVLTPENDNPIEKLLLTLKKDKKEVDRIINNTTEVIHLLKTFDKVEKDKLQGLSAPQFKTLFGKFCFKLKARKDKPETVLSPVEINQLLTLIESLQTKVDPAIFADLKTAIIAQKENLSSAKDKIVEVKHDAEASKLKAISPALALDPPAKYDYSQPLLVLIDTNIYARPINPRRFMIDDELRKQGKLYSNAQTIPVPCSTPKKEKSKDELEIEHRQLKEFDKFLYLDIANCGKFQELITEASVIECAGAKYDHLCGQEVDNKYKAEQRIDALLCATQSCLAKDPGLCRSQDHLQRLRQERRNPKILSPLTATDLFELIDSVTTKDIQKDMERRPEFWKNCNASKLKELLNASKDAILKDLNIGKLGLGDLMYIFNSLVYDAPIISENHDMIRQVMNSNNVIVKYLFSGLHLIVPLEINPKKDALPTRDAVHYVTQQVEKHYFCKDFRDSRNAALVGFFEKFKQIKAQSLLKSDPTSGMAKPSCSELSLEMDCMGKLGMEAITFYTQRKFAPLCTSIAPLCTSVDLKYKADRLVPGCSTEKDLKARLEKAVKILAPKTPKSTKVMDRATMVDKLMSFSMPMPLAIPRLERAHSETLTLPAKDLVLIRTRSS